MLQGLQIPREFNLFPGTIMMNSSVFILNDHASRIYIYCLLKASEIAFIGQLSTMKQTKVKNGS
jgi:hypothetical protein